MAMVQEKPADMAQAEDTRSENQAPDEAATARLNTAPADQQVRSRQTQAGVATAQNPAVARSASAQPAKPATRSNANAATAGGEADQNAPLVLEGNVDAIDRERLFGWVWCPQRPDAKIQLLVRLNGHTLMKVTADKERIDLRRNGIGDGAHAFEVELPEAALATVEALGVVAVTPETGTEVDLRIPSQTEQAAQSAMNAPLGKILDRLDRLLAAQHILQNGQREAAKRLIESSKRMDELASADDGIEAGVKLVRNGQEDLASRVEQLEVFLVRFDKSLGGFDERLAVLSERHRNDLKTPLLLLSIFIGIVCGIVLGAMIW